MSILLLSAGLGTALDIEASGTDEREAIQAVQQFFDTSPDDGDPGNSDVQAAPREGTGGLGR